MSVKVVVTALGRYWAAGRCWEAGETEAVLEESQLAELDAAKGGVVLQQNGLDRSNPEQRSPCVLTYRVVAEPPPVLDSVEKTQAALGEALGLSPEETQAAAAAADQRLKEREEEFAKHLMKDPPPAPTSQTDPPAPTEERGPGTLDLPAFNADAVFEIGHTGNLSAQAPGTAAQTEPPAPGDATATEPPVA